uniref:Tyrosine-protein kinase n=1 Tax=Leptobrachium leishanense TaxID=445787 RepID=A0A8C5R727_9ANUR
MESFVKKNMSCFHCLWVKIWPEVENPQEMIVTVGSQMQEYRPKADLLKALYDFTARSTEELSVYEGEELCKIKEDGDYVIVRKLTGTMEVGMVPANYVTFIQNPIHSDAVSEQGFMNVENRLEAESLLLTPLNASGSYLIRPSDSKPGLYSLSVRKENKVIHFLIQKTDRGEFFLQEGRAFLTIHELINFHKTNWKLLNAPLRQPCQVSSQDNVSNFGDYSSINEFQDVSLQDEWERPRSEFRLVTKLGEGFFGEVWKAVWKNTTPVAIKTFKKEHLIHSDMEKEMTALKSLSHPNLIQLLAICSTDEPVYIVTELMTKGNLNEFLKSPEGVILGHIEFLFVICQIAEGMSYLESKKVVHRDLASRNILVGEDLVCKIADFGLARLLKDDLYSPERNRAIPVKWTAPEAIARGKFSTKSDVWAFGILVYEVYTFGQMPYKDMTNQEVAMKVDRGYRLPQTSNCSPQIYGLMMECWHKKAEDRPSFHDIVQKLYVIEHTIN